VSRTMAGDARSHFHGEGGIRRVMLLDIAMACRAGEMCRVVSGVAEENEIRQFARGLRRRCGGLMAGQTRRGSR